MSLDAALLLDAFGFPIVPVDGKRPTVRKWQTAKWDEERLRKAYAGRANGVGLILDGFVDFDEDGPNAGREFDELGLPATVSWQSAKGRHHLNKLAPGVQLPSNQFKIGTQLEVRSGRDLQSVIPPSGNREWIIPLLENEPVCLSDLGFLPSSDPAREVVRPESESTGDRPGDIFELTGNWADDILEPLGYTLIKTEGDTQYWKRPGRTEHEWSLSVGYCKSTEDQDKLYAFSTETPFPPNEAISKFQAYACAFHDGDRTEATKSLRAKGFAPTIEFPDDIPTDLIASPDRPTVPGLPCSTSTGDTGGSRRLWLPRLPGTIEQIAEWHANRSQVRDLQAGRVVGLMALSWLYGRRAKLATDGTRPNLFTLLTGRPGSGKTEAIGSLQTLVNSTVHKSEFCADLSSGQALEDAMAVDPRLLFVKDEAQDMVRSAGTNEFKAGLLDKIKEIYTCSRRSLNIRRKANEKERPPVIEQPYLTTMLVATGSAIWTEFSERLYRDGFIPRVILLSVDNDASLNSCPVDTGIPNLFDAMDIFPDDPETNPEDNTPTDVLPTLRDVEVTRKATTRLAELKRAWREDTGDDIKTDIYTRGQEHVCKLVMLMAISEGSWTVDAKLVDLATGMVEGFMEEKLRHWESRVVGDQKNVEMEKRLLHFVKKYSKGDKGALVSDLRYRMKGVKVDDTDRLVLDLLRQGLLTTKAKITGTQSFNAKAIRVALNTK